MNDVIAPGVPESVWKFLCDVCRMSPEILRRLPGETLPEPARQLLVHRRDMTSTLSAFHGSALRVDILQQRRNDEVYLREVFLRTLATDAIVEYGVIGVALEQFSPPQQEAIEAGETPLGGLLHQFKIPFESSPICFFSVPTDRFTETPLAALKGATCFGRFNQLAKPTGERLAWIMEILPQTHAGAQF